MMVLLAIKMMLSIHDNLVRDSGHNRDALDSLDGDEDSDETRAFTLHGLNARSCTVMLILMIADFFMIIKTDGVFEKTISRNFEHMLSYVLKVVIVGCR
jgi:hypothetical protein